MLYSIYVSPRTVAHIESRVGREVYTDELANILGEVVYRAFEPEYGAEWVDDIIQEEYED